MHHKCASSVHVGPCLQAQCARLRPITTEPAAASQRGSRFCRRLELQDILYFILSKSRRSSSMQPLSDLTLKLNTNYSFTTSDFCTNDSINATIYNYRLALGRMRSTPRLDSTREDECKSMSHPLPFLLFS